jgi:hypothetical protein
MLRSFWRRASNQNRCAIVRNVINNALQLKTHQDGLPDAARDLTPEACGFRLQVKDLQELEK